VLTDGGVVPNRGQEAEERMTDRDQPATGSSSEDDSSLPPATAGQPEAMTDEVRSVVGRRGYDEAEDETATETEEH